MKGLLDLDHSTLYRMRSSATDQDEQDMLAAMEHRAFAREATAENPLMAMSLLAAVPAYQGAKLLGLTNSRSRPSWGQLGHGLLGIADGLSTWARK